MAFCRADVTVPAAEPCAAGFWVGGYRRSLGLCPAEASRDPAVALGDGPCGAEGPSSCCRTPSACLLARCGQETPATRTSRPRREVRLDCPRGAIFQANSPPGLLGAVSLCRDAGPRKTRQYHRKCCWIRGHTRTRVSDSRRPTRPPSITKAATQVTFPLSQESLRLR